MITVTVNLIAVTVVIPFLGCGVGELLDLYLLIVAAIWVFCSFCAVEVLNGSKANVLL